jgi:hypothetical protein
VTVFGLIGAGDAPKKVIDTSLDDLFEAEAQDKETMSLVLPYSDQDDAPKTVSMVLRWAARNEVPYTLVLPSRPDKDFDDEFYENADKALVSKDVDGKILSVVLRDEGKVLALWEDDETFEETIVAAIEEGIQCLDLTSGLRPITFEDAEEGDEPEEEPEPPAKPTRAKKAAAPEPEVEEDEPAPKRRSPAKKAAAEEETAEDAPAPKRSRAKAADPEPVEAENEDGSTAKDEPPITRAELEPKALRTLKSLAISAGYEASSLNGLTKDQVIALILGEEAPEAPAGELAGGALVAVLLPGRVIHGIVSTAAANDIIKQFG